MEFRVRLVKHIGDRILETRELYFVRWVDVLDCCREFMTHTPDEEPLPYLKRYQISFRESEAEGEPWFFYPNAKYPMNPEACTLKVVLDVMYVPDTEHIVEEFRSWQDAEEARAHYKEEYPNAWIHTRTVVHW